MTVQFDYKPEPGWRQSRGHRSQTWGEIVVLGLLSVEALLILILFG